MPSDDGSKLATPCSKVMLRPDADADADSDEPAEGVEPFDLQPSSADALTVASPTHSSRRVISTR